MNALFLLGTGLLKNEKKITNKIKKSQAKENALRAKKASAVERFLRETLGTHLIRTEKNN